MCSRDERMEEWVKILYSNLRPRHWGPWANSEGNLFHQQLLYHAAFLSGLHTSEHLSGDLVLGELRMY